MRKANRFLPASLLTILALGTTSVAVAGCGNGWLCKQFNSSSQATIGVILDTLNSTTVSPARVSYGRD
jgi:hypothetical protein